MKRLVLSLALNAPDETAQAALARHLTEVPRRELRAAFSRKDVKRNGQRIGPQTQVAAGDVLEVYVPQVIPLAIVFSDAQYMVINKAQGMPVQGDGSVEAVHLRAFGAPVFACHRLDVNTGGLALFARDEAALQRATEAFAARRVEKAYQAVVQGVPSPSQAVCDAYLKKDARRATVWVSHAAGEEYHPIRTGYRVLEAAGESSLLEIDLFTGRTHQIRAHMAYLGHPVLGDDKYGDRAYNKRYGMRRQLLWATRLTLWDGRTFTAEAAFDPRWKEPR